MRLCPKFVPNWLTEKKISLPIIVLKIHSFDCNTLIICGSLPSQNVSIAIKFFFTSFPNKSIIFPNIYFWLVVNLALLDCATKQIAFKSNTFVSNASLICLVISLSCSIPLVSPNPGVSIIFIGGVLFVLLIL